MHKAAITATTTKALQSIHEIMDQKKCRNKQIGIENKKNYIETTSTMRSNSRK